MKTAKFRGKRYSILFTHLGGNDVGLCDDPSSSPAGGRKIRIDNRLEGKELFDTLIHEALHACLWDLNEDAIESSSTGITNFLWGLGFRRQGEQ